MPKEDIKNVGVTGPTIDSIEVGEFESHADVKEVAQQSRAAIPKVQGNTAHSSPASPIIASKGLTNFCRAM
jgi:hypothetical protein